MVLVIVSDLKRSHLNLILVNNHLDLLKQTWKSTVRASEAKHEKDIWRKGEDNWNKRYGYIKKKCAFYSLHFGTGATYSLQKKISLK